MSKRPRYESGYSDLAWRNARRLAREREIQRRRDRRWMWLFMLIGAAVALILFGCRQPMPVRLEQGEPAPFDGYLVPLPIFNEADEPIEEPTTFAPHSPGEPQHATDAVDSEGDDRVEMQPLPRTDLGEGESRWKPRDETTGDR